MLLGFLNVLFVILCFLTVFLILLQRSKGSLGISGSVGSNAQMIFGSAGGQDIFKKITWIFVACFMGGSLVLALLRNRAHYRSSKYLSQVATIAKEQQAEQSDAKESAQSGADAATDAAPVTESTQTAEQSEADKAPDAQDNVPA